MPTEQANGEITAIAIIIMNKTNKLTEAELTRYGRQVSLKEIGEAGQLKLKNANVLVIGCGGLGCPAITYLAAAGIGRITIVDNDVVDLSNLHRQTLYSTDHLGEKKVFLAGKRVQKNNPLVKIECLDTRFSKENAAELLNNRDAVLDCTDNFSTRQLLGEKSGEYQIPLVFASVLNYEAQVTVFNFQEGPAYHDLFPELPKDGIYKPEDIGLFGVLPGIAGALQANELIKIITGCGEVLSGKLLVFSIQSNRFNVIRF